VNNVHQVLFPDSRHHELHDLLDALFDGSYSGEHVDVRVCRGFVGGADTGEVRNLSGSCLFIDSFHVPTLTHLERRVDKHLEEIIRADNFPCHIPHVLGRTDKAVHRHHPALHKELRHLGDPADILCPVRFSEAQVIIDSGTDVIPVQHLRQVALRSKLPFSMPCKRRLSRPGQPGQPQRATPLPEHLFLVIATENLIKYRMNVFHRC